MFKQNKWIRGKKDLKVGDIILRKDETAAGQTYKYAKVTKVHVSTDGRVRAADIEYKLLGESVYMTTTRPIHKLVMILPVEEQMAARGQEGEGTMKPKNQQHRQQEAGGAICEGVQDGGGEGRAPERGSLRELAPTSEEDAREANPSGQV
jgi:hypothetical protein